MSRPHDPEIRHRLREKAVDYVMTHGMWDLSLRPLASALGTHARMLVYHFGSREGLMREILAGLREREDAKVKAWFDTHAPAGPQTLRRFVRWHWRRISSPGARPAVRLIFELYALALRDPVNFPGVLEVPVGYWRRLAELSGLRGTAAETTATLLLAATRGLMLDAAGTGDRKRADRALKALLMRLQPARKARSASALRVSS